MGAHASPQAHAASHRATNGGRSRWLHGNVREGWEQPMSSQGGMVSRTRTYPTWALLGLTISAALYLLGIAVQVFLAGAAAFGEFQALEDHVNFGRMLGTLTIFMVGFAVAGNLPKPLWVMTVALFFLFGFQFPLAMADDQPYLSALHAVNALVMFGITHEVMSRARVLRKGAAA